MSLATCPPPENLERLFLGGLEEVGVDALERHVQQCASCVAKLDALIQAKDSLSGLLRNAESTPANAAVAALQEKIKSLHPRRTGSQRRGNRMIAITCTSCQKKLSVQDKLAGKKIKCPGCRATLAVPKTVGAPVGGNDMDAQTLAPTMDDPPEPDAAGDRPTQPPRSLPDATQGIEPAPAEHDTSLTDFLAPPQSDDELGRLGGFRILKILGHGGMGVVYLGEDATLSRKVAIKAMLPHLASSKSCQERFIREAKSAAALEHDHIVAIHHVDQDRGAPFIVMPFLKGQPLDERLKTGGPMPLAEVLRIGREIASALEAAHKVGLIHRDIKPGNIWLESRDDGRSDKLGLPPRVKILDFGLARAASQEAGLTQQGAVIGTPAYMVPEQARGDTVDARCDLFSLGVVLYRMCTGKMPFVGKDTVSTLMEVALHEPPAPAKINDELPKDFSGLVMQLLEKDAAKRIGSARAVIDALSKIEAGLKRVKKSADKTQTMPYVAPKKSAGEPSRASGRVKAPKRHRSLTLACIAALGFLGLLGAGGIIYWQTNVGVVQITNHDPKNITVTFDKDSLEFKDGEATLARITPGQHGLIAKLENGVTVKTTDPIVVKRGDTIRLEVVLKPGKLQIVQGDKVLGEEPLPGSPAPAADYALKFDGNASYVEIPDLARSESGPITVEAYVMPQAIVESGYILRVRGDYPVHLRQTDDAWYAIVSVGRASTTKEERVVTVQTSKGTVVPGKRIHLAVVYDGKDAAIFIDGKRYPGAAGMSTANPNTPSFMGARRAGSGKPKEFFDGVIDEVRVSNSARYAKDFTPAKRLEPDNDTVALYHCDEGIGNTLFDSSGQKRHGVIAGAKWVKADETPIGAAPPATKYALRFDDPAVGVLVPTLKLDTRADFTLEAYVTPESLGVPGKPFVGGVRSQVTLKIARWNGPDDGWILGTGHPGNKINAVGPVPVQVKRRTHLAGVRKGNLYQIWVDGKLRGSQEIPSPLADSQYPFFLGDGFHGVIGEVRVSSKARYESEFTPVPRFEPDADTLALYHCDENSGDKLIDASGKNHHGKIVGAKWVQAEATTITPPSSPPRSDLALYLGGNNSSPAMPGKLDLALPFTIETHMTQFQRPATEWRPLWSKNIDMICGKEWGFRLALQKNVATLTAPLQLNQKTHVACVFTGKEMLLFVDGKLAKSKDVQANLPVKIKANLHIGQRFKALIYGIHISQTARYAKDFTPLKRFVPDKDSVALYHCDEGSGFVLKDSSGNNRHFTLAGARWVKVEKVAELPDVDEKGPPPSEPDCGVIGAGHDAPALSSFSARSGTARTPNQYRTAIPSSPYSSSLPPA